MLNGDSEHKTPRAKALARAGRGGSGKGSGATCVRGACLVGGAAVLFLTGVIAGVVFFGPTGLPTTGAVGGLVPPMIRNPAGKTQMPPAPSPFPLDEEDDGDAEPAASRKPAPEHDDQGPETDEPDEPDEPDEEVQAPPSPAAQLRPSRKPRTQTAPVKLVPPSDAWAYFDGSSTLQLREMQDSAVTTLSAWVYLPSPSTEMNVLASNRASGCDGGGSHDGFTFFVNEWGTGNRQLRLEWSDSGPEAGCQTLASPAEAVPLREWTHVAFAFGPAGKVPGTSGSEGSAAALYIGGKVVASTGGVRRSPQSARSLVLGASTDGKFGFTGRMASLFVLGAVATPVQMQHLASAGPASRFRAVTKQAAKHGKLRAAVLLYGSSGKGAQGGRAKDAATEAEVLAGAVTAVKPVEEEQAPGASGPAPGPGLPDDLPPPPPRAERVPLKEDRFDGGGNQWVSRTIKLEASRVKGTTSDPEALADGSFSDDIPKEDLLRSDEQGKERAAAIKAGMQFVWKSYKEKAWGADELKPRSGSSQNNWGGMAFTMIDALDTLWVMGMHDEFYEATEYLKEHLTFAVPRTVSVFETTIRGLGGLLSAYDLSGEVTHLEKAKDLADRLTKSFNTPKGIPNGQINLQTGQGHNSGWTGSASILAELGTVQVEHRYLSHATGIDYYAKRAERPIRELRRHRQPHGLYPIYISPQTGEPTNRQITFGALGDSFYEYLVKVWVQGGEPADGGDRMYRDMYDEAMQGLHDVLLQRSTPSRLQYVADYNGAQAVHKMDHLVCFVPGMLALGAWTAAGTAGAPHVQRDLQAAKAIAYTCYQMYARQSTGISPEYVDFRAGSDLVVPAGAPFYILRPEAAESLYVLHQLTGNPIYREWGWKMWQAIDRHCRTTYGFGAHPDVRDTGRTPDDRMESFFLAETMKYLYMLQSPDHPISLERFVFNTEAHPMRRFDHWGSNENKVNWGFAARGGTRGAGKKAGKAGKRKGGLRGGGKADQGPHGPAFDGGDEDVGSDVF